MVSLGVGLHVCLLLAAMAPDGGADKIASSPASAGSPDAGTVDGPAPPARTDGSADGSADVPSTVPSTAPVKDPHSVDLRRQGTDDEPAAGGPNLDHLRDSADIDVVSPESFDGLSLEEVLNMQVVTATGQEEARALAPANVLVVTRDDIMLRGYRSMAELLAGVPGLFVVDDLVNPSLAVNGVSGGLRGGTRIVRMMINGVEVSFRPDLTAFLGPEYLPMDAIERVEIATGPLSALYGANAFLATVNVITRTPPPGASSAMSLRLTRLGETSGQRGAGTIGFNDGRKSLFVSFVLDQLDRSGMRLERTFPAQDLTPHLFEGRSRDDLRRTFGSFASFRVTGDRLGALSLQGGLQRMDAGTEFQVNSLFSHAGRLSLYNGWSNATWERAWGGHGGGASGRLVETTASIGWSQGGPTRDTQLYLPDSRAVMFKPNYSYGAVTGKLELGLAPGRPFSLAAGIDAEHDRQRILYYTQVFNAPVGQNRPGDEVDVGIGADEPRFVTVRNLGGYVKAGLVPMPERLPDLRLTANTRADVISQGPVSFPWQTSWRAAAAYRFSPAISAKLIVGRAFQVPSAVLNFARPGYGTIGNIVGVANVPGAEPLRPQSVTSLQAGLSATVFDHFALEGEAYLQEVKDRIEFIRYGANYRAANRGDTRQVGLTAIFRFIQRPLSLYLGGNVLRSIVGGTLSDEPPSGFPGATATLGGTFDVPRWDVRLNAETRYVAARGASQTNIVANNQESYHLPAYTKTDLTLSTGFHLFGPGTQTTLLVGVRNLFGVRFSEPGYGGFDIPGFGRLMFVEARQAF